jgi:precorrin-4 methylase
MPALQELHRIATGDFSLITEEVSEPEDIQQLQACDSETSPLTSVSRFKPVAATLRIFRGLPQSSQKFTLSKSRQSTN